MLPELRYRLRRLTMVAFVAIFGLVFAPTISHALNHAKGWSAYSELCSQQDTMSPVAWSGASGDTSPVVDLGHLDHCPLCGLNTHAMGTPPVALTATEPAELRQPLPALFLHAPTPLFVWASAQPRAPPFFS